MAFKMTQSRVRWDEWSGDGQELEIFVLNVIKQSGKPLKTGFGKVGMLDDCSYL